MTVKEAIFLVTGSFFLKPPEVVYAVEELRWNVQDKGQKQDHEIKNSQPSGLWSMTQSAYKRSLKRKKAIAKRPPGR
jgi:hypothetical protein